MTQTMVGIRELKAQLSAYMRQVKAGATLADTFAWEHGLRGHDAVHLAAASLWQDAMSERGGTLSTFDRRLWAAAGPVGLALQHGVEPASFALLWRAP